ARGNERVGSCRRGRRGEGGRVLRDLRGTLAQPVPALRRTVRAHHVRGPGGRVLDARSPRAGAARRLPPPRAGGGRGAVSGGGDGAALVPQRRASRARRAHLRGLGAAAALPHRGSGHHGARRAVGSPVAGGARGGRDAGVGPAVGLGAEPVSLHPAARSLHRGRGRSRGYAAARAGRTGVGRGGVAAVALLFVPGVQELSQRYLAYWSAPRKCSDTYGSVPSTQLS